MKKITFTLLLFLISLSGFAQCLGTFAYPSTPVISNNDGNIQEITTCNWGGDYASISGLVVGNDYVFDSSPSAYLTVTTTSDVVIASGLSPLTVTGITSADIHLHIHADAACTEDMVCKTTSVQCVSPSCIPPALPDCATLTAPTDTATNVALVGGGVNIAWTAPTTGGTVTGYKVYFGTSVATLTLLGTSTNLTELINGLSYSTTYYWQIVPTNSTGDATGCSVFSFTTEAAPAPPANDNLCNAISLTVGALATGNDYTLISGTAETSEPLPACFDDAEINSTVWFSFNAPASGSVDVTTDFAGGTLQDNDTEIAIYDANGVTCSDLSTLGTPLGCDEDISTTNYGSFVNVSGLTPGNVYYIQVDKWNTASAGTFGIQVNEVLGNSTFSANAFKAYPNPVKDVLNLSHSAEISSVEIFNMLGQKVIAKKLNVTQGQVDMSSLNSGAYLVKVTANGETKSIKVIKQ